jgi:hypothetical protein
MGRSGRVSGGASVLLSPRFWSSAWTPGRCERGILVQYLRLGGPASPLGYAITDECGLSGGRRNDFHRYTGLVGRTS